MRSILLLFVLLCTHGLFAQNVLRLEHLNVDDGLSQSSANYIFQDRLGFIWIATGDGLNRYDGKEFVVYKSRFNDTFSSQMRDRNINSRVFEDQHDRLWFSTDAGTAFMNCRNKDYKVVVDKYTIANEAMLIGLDSTTLWTAVSQHGVYAIDINTHQHRVYPFKDTFQTNPKKLYAIRHGAITRDGLWITDRAGLLYFSKTNDHDERKLIDYTITSVTLLHSRLLLLTATDGVYLYDPAHDKPSFIAIKQPGSTKPILFESCAEDAANNVAYLGALNSGALCRLDLATGKYEFIEFQNNPVNCLFIDRSQNLWVGTEGNGIFKLDIKRPKFFCYPPRLQAGETDVEKLMVKSIYRDDSGKIWMGTFNRGLILYDPKTQKQHTINLEVPTDALIVSTILKDSAGNLVVTIGSNIIWLDPATHAVRRKAKLSLSSSLSPEEPIIYSLIEWKQDHYLAGTNVSLYSFTFRNGFDEENKPLITSSHLQLSAHIYNLHKEADGTISVGKRSGYASIRMLSDTSLALLSEGFDHVPVRHFYMCTAHHTLWIATERGLIAFDQLSHDYRTFDETSGLANSFVYSILAQNDSTLWISTNQGISLVHVTYGSSPKEMKAHFINYNARDGLQSNEFNTGSYFESPDGTFFFGGIAGINWFRPGKVETNPHKAIPLVASIFINDTPYTRDTTPWVRDLTLPWRNNTISFSLRALEYTRQDQNMFAYMLEGVDKDWVITTNDKVRYSNLPPGSYTFMLKVSNNEGLWNEDPLLIHITVLPPWYQTWWFRALALASAVASVVLINRAYVRQKIKARTRELEKQQALYLERLRISKDVHDDLGSGLSKISLIAELAQKRAGAEVVGNDIRNISSVSKELVENMRDLIWVLNPENTTLEQLVTRLREYCSDYLENIPIDVTLDFPHDVPTMRIAREAQRNIFLTTKEAINNCVKHAEATELRISLKIEDGVLSITVNDNGKGFEMNRLKGSGNGLRNMRQRIELVGGRFDITSVKNNTTISIMIPLAACAVDKLPL